VTRDVSRDPFDGPGKPELMKHAPPGHWSRRTADEHRLAYRVQGDELQIAQCCFQG
jgi:toxin YoeB